MQRLRHWTAQSEFRASNLFHAFGLQNNESSVIHFRGTYFSKQSLFLNFHENSLKYLKHFERKKNLNNFTSDGCSNQNPIVLLCAARLGHEGRLGHVQLVFEVALNHTGPGINLRIESA